MALACERALQNAKFKDMTSIMIIAFADMIYVLEEGAIREQGTYTELCEKSQYFKNLSNTDHE